LENQQRLTQVPEELAAGIFEYVQVAGIIHVVADGTLCISDTMRAGKGAGRHTTYKLRIRRWVEKPK
jgi:hypothetical protein